MSDDRLDYDMSDVSVSESSWADAQADTPTMGQERSDSEDTLSNLSFDNDIEEGLENPPQSQSQVPCSSSEDIGGGAVGGIMMEGPITSTRPTELQTSLNNGGLVVNGRSFNDKNNTTSFVGDGNGSSNSEVQIQVRVTNEDSQSFQLDLPPGTVYQPPTVDFPSSPSQLKISQGEAFMPKEEQGTVSEDDASFASSYRAHLDLNFQNGGVRLTKKEEESLQSTVKPPAAEAALITIDVPTFEISECPEENINENQEPESLLQLEASDVLDDYMEDFYLPMSHESVMSRQTSFRRKVQKHLETAAAETAINELNKFDRMLASYEEEPGDDKHESTENPSISIIQNVCEFCHNNKDKINNCVKCVLVKTNIHHDLQKNEIEGTRKLSRENLHSTPTNFLVINPDSSRNNNYNSKILDFEDEGLELEDGTPSMAFVDIDAICDTHAPNLMNGKKSHIIGGGGEDEPESLKITMNGELESNYFLPKSTLDKLDAVYESINFTNLYTLSGELKHILSPIEIEEIIANRDQLENIISPAVMAALSWSLNESSLPPGSMVVGGMDEKELLESLKPKIKETTTTTTSDILENPHIIDTTKESKSSSISNGFHSDSNHSDVDVSEDENSYSKKKSENNNNSNTKKVVPVKDEYDDNQMDNRNKSNFDRGTFQTSSFRRKITLANSLTNGGDMETMEKYIETEDNNSSGKIIGKKIEAFPLAADRNNWASIENLNDFDIESSGNESTTTGGGGGNNDNIFLLRRDSKRFNKGDTERIIQGLFVESNNTSKNGTLKRIKAPLHLVGDDDDIDTEIELYSRDSSLVDVSLEAESDIEAKNAAHKKRIGVDDKILSIASVSELDDSSQATDVTQSDVFHSIVNSFSKNVNEDKTLHSEDGTDEDVTLDIDTPDDMEDSILGNLDSIVTSPTIPIERIPEMTAEEEYEEDRRWRSFRIGANDIQIDLKAIQPYRRVLSHGGYYDAEKKVAIILFSGCFLPDRSRREYSYLMDHLFLYVLSSLEELIVDDYMLVYLHGATPKSCQPTFGWLKRCYQLIDRKLRKNLKGLYLVHSTFWLRTVVACTKPFISTKFSRKMQFVNTLAELCLEIPTEHLVIPDCVLQFDFDLKVAELKRQNQMA